MEERSDIDNITEQLIEYGLPIQQRKYTYNDLIEALSYYINNLITKDFSFLIQLLYRLDISEEQVRRSLKETSGDLTSNAIAKLIIDRQQKKLSVRKFFRKDTDIPEDERW